MELKDWVAAAKGQPLDRSHSMDSKDYAAMRPGKTGEDYTGAGYTRFADKVALNPKNPNP